MLTGRGDLDDQRWLAQQVAALGGGIEAARAIWTNWSDLRNVGRLHPDMSPGEYIASLGLRLTLAEAMAALPEGSSREVGAIAGVDHTTVLVERRKRGKAGGGNPPADEDARVIGVDGKSYPGRVVRAVSAEVIEPKATEPAGAPFWPELLAIRDAIRRISRINPDILAANVPSRRRKQFSKDLRRHGLILGAVAARLEEME